MSRTLPNGKNGEQIRFPPQPNNKSGKLKQCG